MPRWSWRLRIGPALLGFYQYCLGRVPPGRRSFETSLGELIAEFGDLDDRSIKRWIEDLRAPVDDDQVSSQTKYQRLGLLRVSKGKLTGRFTIEPLAPRDFGPQSAPRVPGRQKRLLEEGPQDFAQTPAVDPPQTCAQEPAVAQTPAVDRLLGELRRLAGEDRFVGYFAEPTRWTIEGNRLVAVVPHPCYVEPFKMLFRSVIEPACRAAFPRGEALQLRLLDSSAPADFGRDRPQDFAQSPAVLFSFLLFKDLQEALEEPLVDRNLKEKNGAPQVLARADAIAARFHGVPASFFRWQWVQTAWAIEARKISLEAIEACICEALAAPRTPHWLFVHEIRKCFAEHRVQWLDPRKGQQRKQLVAQLASAGVEWDEAWEGSAKRKLNGPPRQPR